MKKKHTCLKWLSFPFLILALAITLQFGRQNATLGAASAAVPTYPEKFVGYPEYNTTDGKGAAGMASVVKLKGGTQSYIVSVRHVLGPNGAFEKQAAAKDVPTFVKSIRITSFSGGVRNYNVTGLLIPTKRLEADGGEPVDDMAIYVNKDQSSQSQAMVLADTVPSVGTQVWLISGVRGGVSDGQIMPSAKVMSNKPWIIFRFDNDQVITHGRSGAPVLNADGEVVGVYSGHGSEQGHTFGFVIPAPLIATTIKASRQTR